MAFGDIALNRWARELARQNPQTPIALQRSGQASRSSIENSFVNISWNFQTKNANATKWDQKLTVSLHVGRKALWMHSTAFKLVARYPDRTKGILNSELTSSWRSLNLFVRLVLVLLLSVLWVLSSFWLSFTAGGLILLLLLWQQLTSANACCLC